MQATNHRWTYYYDFHLKSFPDDAPQFDFEEIIPKVQQLLKAGNAVHQYKNHEITIRIKEIEVKNKYFGILLHLSDIKATDPAFSHTGTGAVRVEEKKEGEGIAAACHILFKRGCINDQKGRHLAIIEEVIGIPKSMVEQFMTFILKTSCETHYKNPIEKGKKEKICRPIARFNGHASTTLKDSLKTGTLQYITLFNHKKGEYIDDNKELLTTEKVIKLQAVGAPTGNKAVDLVKRARALAYKDSYDEIRVQYSEVVSEEAKTDVQGKKVMKEVKKQRTIPIETKGKEGDLANLLFTKSQLIELDNEIGQCEETMHKELKSKMKEQLLGI